MNTKAPTPGLVSLTYIIYGLHAFSAFSGVGIIALILSYIKRGDAHGTYLESHLNWLIRTFWFALLWLCIAGLLFITVVGILPSLVMAWLTGVWVLYRILRGILCMLDEKPIIPEAVAIPPSQE